MAEIITPQIITLCVFVGSAFNVNISFEMTTFINHIHHLFVYYVGLS